MAALNHQAALFRSFPPREARYELPLHTLEPQGSSSPRHRPEATAVAVGSSSSATVGAVSHRGWLVVVQVWPTRWQRRIRIGSSRLVHIAVDDRWVVPQLQAAGTQPPYALVLERSKPSEAPQRVTLPPFSQLAHVVGDELWLPWGERQLTAVDLGTGRESVHALAPQALRGLGCYQGRLAGVSTERKPVALSGHAPSLHDALWLHMEGQLLTAQPQASDRPRWLWAAEAPLHDVTYSAGSILSCTGDGLLGWLDARTGAPQRQIRLQEDLQQCVFDRPAWVSTAGWENPASVTLLRQLRQALLSGVLDEAQQQRMAGMIHLQPSELATQVLLDVASSDRVSRAARERAGELLLARPAAHAEVALIALQRDPTPLSEIPLGALAQLLAQSRHPQAASTIAARLLSPELSGLQAAQLARALGPLAGAAQLRQLVDFFTVHRASASSQDWANALNSVADTLFRVGGSPEREVLKLAASDPLTTPAVRSYLQSRLSTDGPPTGRRQRTAVD